MKIQLNITVTSTFIRGMCIVMLLASNDATGLTHFNIKFFRPQHQISGINIKRWHNTAIKTSFIPAASMKNTWLYFILTETKLEHTDVHWQRMSKISEHSFKLYTYQTTRIISLQYNLLLLILYAQQILLSITWTNKNVICTAFTLVL